MSKRKAPVLCPFCLENSSVKSVKTTATHIGAQSINAGLTVTWTPICAGHAYGWNDCGDWQAPVFRLGKRIE